MSRAIHPWLQSTYRAQQVELLARAVDLPSLRRMTIHRLGECRVFRADVQDLFSLRIEYGWEGHRAVTNYMHCSPPKVTTKQLARQTEVGEALFINRNWWMGTEKLFRGLALEDSPWPTRLGIVYAIDCEHMDDPAYQEQVTTPQSCGSQGSLQTNDAGIQRASWTVGRGEGPISSRPLLESPFDQSSVSR